MTPEDYEKVADILKKGGSIIMHKNDLERLKEATQAGNEPDLFKGIKVYADRLGAVKEGEPVAAIIGGISSLFDLRDAFSACVYPEDCITENRIIDEHVGINEFMRGIPPEKSEQNKEVL